MTLVDQINTLLPQTQCGQCGFKGCKPYAEAIAAQTANINQCPPGGETGIIQLSGLLGIPAKPLNTKYGLHKTKQIAVIDEEACIGCVKCLAACPVDAIIGAAKLMHTVIAAECTGCELCVEPCPVDCITLEPLGLELSIEEVKAKKMTAMRRYAARNQRIETQEKEKKEKFRKLKEIHSLGKL